MYIHHTGLKKEIAMGHFSAPSVVRGLCCCACCCKRKAEAAVA